MTTYILLLLTALLLLLCCVIAVLRLRPRSQHGVSPSLKSKVTPLGIYKPRMVRTDVIQADLDANIARASERVYVPEVEEEA